MSYNYFYKLHNLINLLSMSYGIRTIMHRERGDKKALRFEDTALDEI